MNHIVICIDIDSAMVIACLHCGDIYRPQMPITTARLCEINDAMRDIHGICKAPLENEPINHQEQSM